MVLRLFRVSLSVALLSLAAQGASGEALISQERLLSGAGKYQIIDDAPWRREVIASEPGSDFYQPRAYIGGEGAYLLFLEKPGGFGPGPLYLVEYDLVRFQRKRVDEMAFEGGGFYFNSAANLLIEGAYVYYFSDLNGPARRYRIGSGEPAVETDFLHEREDWLRAEVSPNGRYIAIANATGYHESVYPQMSAEFRTVVEALGDQPNATGVSIYDRVTETAYVLFEQAYEGDWSVGRIIWADDGERFFFDNSGAVACIWEYHMPTRRLTKIVPEHEARHPFFVRLAGREQIFYVEEGRVMMATSE